MRELVETSENDVVGLDKFSQKKISWTFLRPYKGILNPREHQTLPREYINESIASLLWRRVHFMSFETGRQEMPQTTKHKLNLRTEVRGWTDLPEFAQWT